MFTINFKGSPNPKNNKLVKIEVVFYRSGYSRVTKSLKDVTGYLKDWDDATQSFKLKDDEHQKKNKILFEIKEQYERVAVEWESKGIDWTPVQWKYCFSVLNKSNKTSETKMKSLSQMLDYLIEKFNQKERIKNGEIVKSSSNVKEYGILKRVLSEFTTKKYKMALNRIYLADIDEKFLTDFIQFLQQRGKKKGNNGAVSHRVRKLRAVCNYGIKLGVPGADIRIFDNFSKFMQHGKFESRAVSTDIIKKIENIDRSLLTKNQNFHVDIFLFSLYSGGISNIDLINLTKDRINDGIIEYERMKVPKDAIVPLISKAKAIIDKYEGLSYGNYVFPILTHKHQTEDQKRNRVESFSYRLNNTLEKVCELIGYPEKITWYSARGSFITALIDAGCPVSLVAVQSGNSAQIIEKHYYKMTKPNEVRKVNEHTFEFN